MGVQISDIIPREEISLKSLRGKTIAVDAMNTLYQFLTTIRQQDGTPLMDREGNITSHLSGLFYRNINLLQKGIKPIYVFDGKPPELKMKELEKRKERKEIAKEKYEAAKQREDIASMRKYSQQFVKITDKIIKDSKELLEAMGIPCVESYDEGEAEAASLVKNNFAWASASQDYDSLLYGTPKLVRNLSLSRKRKTSIGEYIETKMEIIEFEKVLSHLQINQEQLICLGILVGTDFNPGGVKGIGQKRALDIVQKNNFPVKIFEYIEKSEKYNLDFNWQEVFKEFKTFEAKTKEQPEIKEINEEKVKEILLKGGFSEERIASGLKRLHMAEEQNKQKGLSDFLG